MNERIKALTEVAFNNANYPTDQQYRIVPNTAFCEKLAELIVKETMQVVANQLPSNLYLDVAHAVIEHFGVDK